MSELWLHALEQLRFQMPVGTFDSWLKDSMASQDAGHMVITVASSQAAEWLDTQLRHVIRSTVDDVAKALGQPVPQTLQFACTQCCY